MAEAPRPLVRAVPLAAERLVRARDWLELLFLAAVRLVFDVLVRRAELADRRALPVAAFCISCRSLRTVLRALVKFLRALRSAASRSLSNSRVPLLTSLRRSRNAACAASSDSVRRSSDPLLLSAFLPFAALLLFFVELVGIAPPFLLVACADRSRM
ncbi:hypothetical protein SAMN02745716_0493 [Thermoleophilum album]|uniref:Uncharacterized protein n=1 Tax=Thermoleophilum album TaxID=29539 RepID=A0A1H6FIG9_THEAL|nr:hypothetical protein SAMN02745716_0493 [Thermoleophilum album]